MATLTSSRRFRSGDAVSVHGLCSAEGSWINGATGTVVAEENEDGRLTVLFCCGNPSRIPAEKRKIKPSNLRPVPAALQFHPEPISFGTDLARQLPSKPLRERFQAAGRAFARAQPWDHRYSAQLPVTIRLLRKRSAGEGDVGGGGADVVRSVVVSLVGKSGNAFGASIFTSYARFVSFRQNPGMTFEGSMPLFVHLGSWADDECSGRALAANPRLSTGLHACNRDPRGVDAAELLLALAALETIPPFWEELTSQPPRDEGVAIALGYRHLSRTYPLGDVAALGRLINDFDPPPATSPDAPAATSAHRSARASAHSTCADAATTVRSSTCERKALDTSAHAVRES